MKQRRAKITLIRFLWSLFPWLVVCGLFGFVLVMAGRINEARARLDESKKNAMEVKLPPVRVISLALQAQRLEDRIDLPAQVEPYEDLWVRAEVSGQVVEVLVEEGQTLERGQALVRLDDRDYRTRLARIEANHRLAEAELKRMASLAEKKVISDSRLDSVEAQFNDLSAQLNEARLALERTRITSPIDGRINEIRAKKGVLLGVGDQVAQVLQFDKVKVTVGVPESDVAAVFDLEEADVVIEALDGLRIKGRKFFLSRKPRSLSRLYDLELEVPNPGGRILPGMFARVELVKQVFQDALAIPVYAVISQDDQHIVYVEKDGLAQRRAVELGILSGWQVHVVSGLSPGDRLIVVGHRLLDDGQEVEVIKEVTDPGEIMGS